MYANDRCLRQAYVDERTLKILFVNYRLVIAVCLIYEALFFLFSPRRAARTKFRPIISFNQCFYWAGSPSSLPGNCVTQFPRRFDEPSFSRSHDLRGRQWELHRFIFLRFLSLLESAAVSRIFVSLLSLIVIFHSGQREIFITKSFVLRCGLFVESHWNTDQKRLALVSWILVSLLLFFYRLFRVPQFLYRFHNLHNYSNLLQFREFLQVIISCFFLVSIEV